jgi:hypothetical protein
VVEIIKKNNSKLLLGLVQSNFEKVEKLKKILILKPRTLYIRYGKREKR